MISSNRSTKARGLARLVAVVLVLSVAAPGLGGAHAPTHGFSDAFATLGPLAAGPSDAYEVKSGNWVVMDRAIVDVPPIGQVPQAGTQRVLVQTTRASDPAEPIVMLRARSFRSFTAQVTAALIDDTPGGSVGLVFRAPVLEDGLVDKDNLYLFTAARTGIVGPFTTGQAFLLFKRVARGYYLLNTKIANTWFDLTKPHEYKVVMTGGHIQAFVDGRLVIEHVDANAGDQPTTNDPLPGLPFDAGSVGLRTSVSRAWFDNFFVVGGDAYEGRASAADAFVEHGVNINGFRRGVSVQLSNYTKAADTGFVYHDHDGYDDAVIRPLDPNETGSPSAGAELRVRGIDGVSVATARVAGVNTVISDPTKRVRVTITGAGIETTASASCSGTSSAVNLDGVSVVVEVRNDGVEQVPAHRSEYLLSNGYPANTVLHEIPGQISILAHAQRRSPTTKRIEVSALRIEMPAHDQMIGTTNLGRAPVIEYSLASVVAGRYCV